MADLKERILVELESIDLLMTELKNSKKLSDMSNLELAGTGALIHNFYNGIENIMKQIFIFTNTSIPSGTFWHKDLLESASENDFLSNSTKKRPWSSAGIQALFCPRIFT